MPGLRPTGPDDDLDRWREPGGLVGGAIHSSVSHTASNLLISRQLFFEICASRDCQDRPAAFRTVNLNRSRCA